MAAGNHATDTRLWIGPTGDMAIPLNADIPETPEVPKTYRELLAKAGIPKDELLELSRLKPLHASVDYIITIALIFLVPVAYFLVPHPAMLVVCVLANIHTFNRFAQIIHGSDHGGLFSNPTANSVFGNLAGSFLGYARAGHQLSHQQHHLYLNTERDSDRIWGRPDETMGEMRGLWLKDLLMVTAVQRLLQYSQTDRKTYEVSPWKKLTTAFLLQAAKNLWPVAITQAVVLAYYSLIIGPGYYFLLYLLPIVTIYPAQIRLRTAVEHAFDAGYIPTTPEAIWVARSVNANLIEKLIIAPLHIPYHFEHHLLPGVPYYNLPRVRELLEEKGFPVPTAPGYLGFIRRKARAERLVALSA